MNFYFAVSKVCNLRCSYCYVPEYNKSMKKFVDDRALQGAKDFVEKAKKENTVLGTCILHGAEPMVISPEVLGEIINIFYTATQRAVRVQTNGTHNDIAYLSTVLDVIGTPCKFNIGVTMDGCAMTHNPNRQNTWDLVLRNLLIKKGMGFGGGILTVITKEVVGNLKNFGYWVEYMELMGFRIKFKLAEHGYELSHEENIKFAQWLIDSGNKMKLQGFQPKICILKGNNCDFYEFDVDGGVYSCNKAYSEEGKFGNWRLESFEELKAKREVLYQDTPIDIECYGCEYWEQCHGGCPVSRVNKKSIDCTIKRYVWDDEKNNRTKK